MRTAHLIRALAADSDARKISPGRALALALIPGVVISLCLLLAFLGLRPHLIALLGEPRLLFKLCLTASLVALSGPLVLRLVKPGAAVRSRVLLLAIVPAFLAAACLVELVVVSPTLWGQELIGSNAVFCLKTIPKLAAAPLIGTLPALRQGAPEKPGLAGAAAGLFAGAIGAALYATHCPDNSPLFVAACIVWP